MKKYSPALADRDHPEYDYDYPVPVLREADATGTCYLASDVDVLLEAARSALDQLERWEELIENDRGSGRTLAEIEEAGEISTAILKLRAILPARASDSARDSK